MRQLGDSQPLLRQRANRLLKTMQKAGKDAAETAAAAAQANGSKPKLPKTKAAAAATSGAKQAGSWLSSATQEWGKQWSTATTQWATAVKKWKGPQVHVDVDMLKPMIDSVRETCKETWTKLPPPVQKTLPYVGVGLLTGLLVQKINDGRILKEQHKNSQLQEQTVLLLKDKQSLENRLSEIQVTSLTSPRSAAEERMALSIAQATSAAAHAADAAAAAATACAVRARKTVPASEYAAAQRAATGKH